MKKRWIALTLAILIVLPTLVACGGGKDPAQTTVAVTTEASAGGAVADTTTAETEYKAVANVPEDANYNGHTFTFLIGGNVENGREKNDFEAETMIGVALNDAIYTRNLMIEERYGIKIETFEEYGNSNSGKGLSYQRLSKAFMANETTYDAAMVSGYDVSTLAYTGYLYDMNEVPYIDVNQHWWDQKVNQDLTVGTRLYYTTGDISTADNDATCAILFSKDLVAQNNLENPYELVESGKWTLDKMLEMCSAVHADLNGDGTYDANDRIGAIVWDDTMMAWVNASGVKCCTMNENGELTLTLNDERTMEFFDKLPAFYADEIAYAYQRVSYDIATPINMFANNQALFFALDVALDHQALDHLMQLSVLAAAVENVAGDADLLEVLLAGVGVVGIDNDGRIEQAALLVTLVQADQILIVVVGDGLAGGILIAAHDGVGIGVTLALDLPAAVDEGMLVLSGGDGVHHDRDVAAGGVLHTDGDIQTAGGQTVLLILGRARADCDIREQVGEIAVIFGIEHFIGTAEAVVAQGGHMQLADGDDALEHIGSFVGVGLVEHALVAVAGGAGLIGIDTGDDHHAILHALLYAAQSADVIEYRLAVVGRAGADDEQEFIRFAAEDGCDLGVSFGLDGGKLFADGVFGLDVNRYG